MLIWFKVIVNLSGLSQIVNLIQASQTYIEALRRQLLKEETNENPKPNQIKFYGRSVCFKTRTSLSHRGLQRIADFVL